MATKFLILLVDDDPDLILTLNRAVALGFPEASFTQSHSSAEALTYINGLEGEGPRLVLLDINLQNKESGLDFLDSLQAHPQARFLPVVMLTISELPTHIIAAYSGGASAFTNKPLGDENWISYLSRIRSYWFKTVTLPPILFHKQL